MKAKYPYNIRRMRSGTRSIWVAKSLALKGCVGQGNAAADALKELCENEREWLNTAKKLGICIPKLR